MNQNGAIKRALLSLRGLSVGDAFGETLFDHTHLLAEANTLPPPPWPYTDDTQMALSIVETLLQHGRIDPAVLSESFVKWFVRNPNRGYGGGAIRLLMTLAQGGDWRVEAPAMFGGEGSYGNGAAMRVAPLGAYFCHDHDAVVENARLSAMPTHTHREAIAGAVAVALAAAHTARWDAYRDADRSDLLCQIAEHLPTCEVRDGIEHISDLPFDTLPMDAAERFGSGRLVSAQDTVPFALWCAMRHAEKFTDALWSTARGVGDIDTTCAIVGGIVALSSSSPIPTEWLQARESLPKEFELGQG